MKSKTRTSKKAKAKRHSPAKIAKDFALALKALKRVAVPKNLLPIRERAMNSIINLNDRLNAEAGKVAKAAERDAKKADRAKAKVKRDAVRVERVKAKRVKLQKRIAALQAEAKKLG